MSGEYRGGDYAKRGDVDGPQAVKLRVGASITSAAKTRLMASPQGKTSAVTDNPAMSRLINSRHTLCYRMRDFARQRTAF